MTIAEVSKQYDIPADTLRYYERVGLIPTVPRSKSGFRDYDEESCNWVAFVKCMRNAGIPIEALIEYVGLFQQGDQTREARKEILLEQRRLLAARLEELQKTLGYLDWKIEQYDNWNPRWEREMKKKEREKGA